MAFKKCIIYTLCTQKKYATWCLIITLADVDRFSKFFPRWFVRKFSMYSSQRFPPHLQYVATLLCQSRKSKNVNDFDSTSTDCWNVPVDTYGDLIYHLTVVRQTVPRLLAHTDWMTDWLTFEVCMSDDVSNQQLNRIQFTMIIVAPSSFCIGCISMFYTYSVSKKTDRYN